jgi:MFS family permease
MGSRIWRIVGAAFVGMLGFGAVIPMLPVYLHEQVGASAFLTGLLIGIASAFALLGRLLAGRTADTKGRRLTLLIGMAFCAAAGILYLPFFGLAGMWPGRVLHGLGEGFFVTAAVAWVVDLAPENRRAQALGFLSSGIWGGLSVGPAIGQVLGTVSHVAGFLTVSSLIVIGILCFTEEHARPHAHVKARWLPRPVILPGVLLGLVNVTYAVMSTFLILLLRQRGHGTTWAFSEFAMAVLFGRAAFGSLPDRIGPRRSLFLGYGFLAVGLIAIAAGGSEILDVPAAIMVGVGYSFPWPALATVVVERVPVSERAAALGALNAFYDLFMAGSSALAGAVAGRFGYASVFWMALGSMCGSYLLVMVTGLGKAGRACPAPTDTEAAPV